MKPIVFFFLYKSKSSGRCFLINVALIRELFTFMCSKQCVD